MDHIKCINDSLSKDLPHRTIIRKVFLTLPTKALEGLENKQFEILDEIRSHFDIPIGSIHALGSAKLGKSLHKDTAFKPGVSDLDLAIIDQNLYSKYVEYVFRSTEGYRNHTTFPRRQGKSTYLEYIQYTKKGIFRADLMPAGDKRKEWNKFFGNLSRKHTDLFKSITASLYMSEAFFENKQVSAIQRHIELQGI